MNKKYFEYEKIEKIKDIFKVNACTPDMIRAQHDNFIKMNSKKEDMKK